MLVADLNRGDGLIEITDPTLDFVPEPASLPLVCTGLLSFGLKLHRQER